MSRLTRPIDYSLGDSLDELLRRRTTFSTMMQFDVSSVEQKSDPSYCAPHADFIATSRNHHLRHLQEPDRYARNHPKKRSRSLFRLPPIESVSLDPLKIIVKRYDGSLVLGEPISPRVQPDTTPLTTSRSSKSSRSSSVGRDETQPASNVLDSNTECAPGVTNIISSVKKDEQKQTGIANSSAKPLDESQQVDFASQQVADIDQRRRESIELEIYSYISSSSSTDNPSATLEKDQPGVIQEHSEISNYRKPPIPPRAKHEVRDVDGSEVKNNTCSPLMASQQRFHEANLSKTVHEETPKNSSFVDDESTSMTSDFKFAYSPVSSASYVTSDDQRSAYKDGSVLDSSFAPKAMPIHAGDDDHDTSSELVKLGSDGSEGDKYRHHPQDDVENSVHSSMAEMHNNAISIIHIKSSDDNTVDRSKIIQRLNYVESVAGGIEMTLSEHQTIEFDDKDALSNGIHEGLKSFVSSLSSKPSSEDSSDSKDKSDSSVAEWDDDLLVSYNMTDPSTASSDSSEATRSVLYHSTSSINMNEEVGYGNSENVCIGLYQDIAYLLTYGNKQQDEGKLSKSGGYDDRISQQDSCASDASNTLDQDDGQPFKVDLATICFVCGVHMNGDQPYEEVRHCGSRDTNLSTISNCERSNLEARDVDTEAAIVEDNSRESCAIELFDELTIQKDSIPDEAIFNQTDSVENNESFVIVEIRNDVEKGVDEVDLADATELELPMLNCWRPVKDIRQPREWRPSDDDQYRPEESLIQRVTRQHQDRPIVLRPIILQDTCASRSEGLVHNPQPTELDEMHLVMKSIEARIQDEYSRSLAPELARCIRDDVNSNPLTALNQHMESLHEQIEGSRLDTKAKLLTKAIDKVSTSVFHIQPTQELGESRNHFIELPIRKLPKSILPPDSTSCANELDILMAIVKEDFCESTTHFCIEDTVSNDESNLSNTSAGAKLLMMDTTEDAVAPEKSAQKSYKLAYETESLNVTTRQPDELGDVQHIHSLLPIWVTSIMKFGISNDRAIADFQDFLNQPTANAEINWDYIPVPELEDLLQKASNPAMDVSLLLDKSSLEFENVHATSPDMKSTSAKHGNVGEGENKSNETTIVEKVDECIGTKGNDQVLNDSLPFASVTKRSLLTRLQWASTISKGPPFTLKRDTTMVEDANIDIVRNSPCDKASGEMTQTPSFDLIDLNSPSSIVEEHLGDQAIPADHLEIVEISNDVHEARAMNEINESEIL